MTTQEMIDAIRKGDRLGHKAMQAIAEELADLRSALDQQLTQLQLLANLTDDPIVEMTIDASADMIRETLN